MSQPNSAIKRAMGVTCSATPSDWPSLSITCNGPPSLRKRSTSSDGPHFILAFSQMLVGGALLGPVPATAGAVKARAMGSRSARSAGQKAC